MATEGRASNQEAGFRPGFLERAALRRRLRFLERTRELAYRDLGGLVFDLHRFGRRRDELVLAKLEALTALDSELRAVRTALGRSDGMTVLREAGVAPCPRCGAIHGSTDRFCPSCGLDLGASEPQTNTDGSPARSSAEALSSE